MCIFQATVADIENSGDTPKTAKTTVCRARYLETDLDDVINSGNMTTTAGNMTTSTPVPRRVIAPPPVAEEIIDSIIEQVGF